MSGDLPRPPKDRSGFKIGIICALSLEADMVEMVFDKRWKKDGIKYGQAENDPNSYTPGVIAGHNVVLTYCPGIGSNSAGQVAASLMSSFNGIKIVLVVGICGTVPFYLKEEETVEIVLGDCLISTGIVQFDLGRRGPDGFAKKDGLDGLGRAGNQIRGIITKLQTQTNRLELTESLCSHLETLQKLDSKRTKYPGTQHDKLYEASYVHTHQPPTCNKCNVKVGICERSCQDLGCDDKHLKSREILQSDPSPRIHFGHFGSSNTVLKSGLERDTLATVDSVIAFEMEGSGTWDVCPTIVIKAACDYADSHKNKKWQLYAAAVAAAGMKAFLQELELHYDQQSQTNTLNTILEVKPTREYGSTNDFSHSTNYGIQAATIHGGIHQHYNDAASQPIEPGNKQVEEAITQADSFIHDSNSSTNRLKIERLSGETLPLEKCYINLALIQQTDRNWTGSEVSPFSLDTRLYPKLDDPEIEVSLEGLFTPRKLANGSVGEPRRIYIRGRAGVGKTTLCKKIVYEFDHQTFGNGLFDRLLWLPLRRLTNERQISNKDDDYGWKNLIQDTYPSSDPKWKRAADIFSARLYEPDFQCRTLLLLDGLDELSQVWNQNDQMFRFLERVIQRYPNIIITSRPQANSLVTGDFDLELETLGFSLTQIDAYLENCVRNPDIIAKMKLFKRTRPLIQGLLRIPIQLDAFCCTWPSEEDSDTTDMSSYNINSSMVPKQENITTMTLLYLSISFELSRKDIGRREGQDRFHSLGDSEVSRLFADEFRVLEELAFQGMVNNVIAYSPKSQDIILSHLLQNGVQLQTPYNSILGRLSFLRSSYIEQVPSKRNYHFLHLTFQEFFAAKHFVRNWLTDTRLTCLKLVTSSQRREMLPITFLQTQKYNPQYNIFWRFVTGLTQVQSYEQGNMSKLEQRKSVVTFFNDLFDEPIDLLGGGHSRLLVYCLSEVSCSNEPAVRNLRRKVEETLCHMLIRDRDNGEYIIPAGLLEEAEFPESVLRSCLQIGEHLPYDTLSVLRSRSFLSSETLDAVAPFLDHKSAPELSSQAAHIILKNKIILSEEVLTRALWKSIAMLDSEDKLVRSEGIEVLRKDSSLPQEIVAALLTRLKTGSLPKRRDVGRVLAYQSLPSQEFGDILVAMLEDTDLETRNSAAKILEYTNDLPQQVLDALLLMLRNGDSVRESFAAHILGRKDSLCEQDIAMLFEWLFDDDKRDSAVTLLKGQPSLPKKIVADLTILLKDEDPDLRSCAARSLKSQIPLSQDVMTELIVMLKDEDVTLRWSAITALSKQPSLDQKILVTLLAIFKDEREYADSRKMAVVTLKKYSSLPLEIVDALLVFLQDKNNLGFIRYHAAQALANQASLSEHVILALLAIFKDEDEDTDIRMCIAAALKYRLSLSQEAVTTLIAILKNMSPFMDSFYVHTESVHTLSREDMISVISMLNGRCCLMYNLLHQSNVYSLIQSLDDQSWKQLWDFWPKQQDVCNISCYELEGLLYVWSGGVLHQISADPKRTRELLKAVSPTNAYKQGLGSVGKRTRKRPLDD